MRFRLILCVTAAGLLAALFGIFFVPFSFYAAGAWFGTAVGICLRKFAIFDNQQAGRFFVVSTGAYLFSLVGTGKLIVVFHSWEHIVFVGPGVLGGLLLIVGTICAVRPRISGVGIFVGVICGPLCGGLLAALGEILGPSVGFTVMKMLAALPSGPDYQDIYAVFVVWQAGMALLLGVLLEGFRSKSSARQEESSAAIPRWFG